METVLQDFAVCVSHVAENLAFTTIAVLTLAARIGATPRFLHGERVLLHPYSFPQLDRSCACGEQRLSTRVSMRGALAAPDARRCWRGARFDALATYRCGDFNLNAEGNVEAVRGCCRFFNFFDVLGVVPLPAHLQRREEQAGADQVAVVSYGFWQRRFRWDPALIGKVIQMMGEIRHVGIMPRGFDYPCPWS